MFGKSFENMIRYYHGEGGAVVGDNDTENDVLWDLLSQATNGKPEGIPIATWKKMQAPAPKIQCSSAVQAIEMAEAMNKLRDGKLVTGILGLVTMSR